MIDEASLQQAMKLLHEIQDVQKMLRRLEAGEPLCLMVGEGAKAGAIELSSGITEAIRAKMQSILAMRVTRLIKEKDELAKTWAEPAP